MGRAILPATVVIDATAITMCTSDYVPNFIYTIAKYDPFSDRFKYHITSPW
jgi:hypothetical protein